MIIKQLSFQDDLANLDIQNFKIYGGSGIGQYISNALLGAHALARARGYQNGNKAFKGGGLIISHPGGLYGPNDNNRETDTFGEAVANSIHDL